MDSARKQVNLAVCSLRFSLDLVETRLRRLHPELLTPEMSRKILHDMIDLVGIARSLADAVDQLSQGVSDVRDKGCRSSAGGEADRIQD